MKYFIGFLGCILLVVALSVWAQSVYQRRVVNAYDSSISLIKEGKYTEAIEKISTTKRDVYDDITNASLYGFEPETQYYKDTWAICLYAAAMQEYSEGSSPLMIQRYLGRIPTEYDGEFKDDIDGLRKTVVSMEAERQKNSEKYDEILSQEIKNKIPYKAMDEKYINSTLVGKADEHNRVELKNNGYHKDEYIWYADNNKDVVLVVDCINGIVTDVKKRNTQLYWTKDGNPNFSATRKKTYVPAVEDYNVAEYSNPEDFYYDNDENFGDYDSAREFYMEFHP